jgi:hypothetical protein
MKYQRHNYFGLCQTERKIVPEPLTDVVAAHTTTFNIHEICTVPILCVCGSYDFHNKQELFYYIRLTSFYKELTLDPLTYVT